MTRSVATSRPDGDDAAIVRLILADRLEEAGALLDARLSRDPGDAAAHMLAGRLAAARRDPAGERAMMARAAELAPDNGDYRALLAQCLARAQDMPGALAAVDAALACAPLGDLALDALAAVLARYGRHGEAAALLGRAVAQGTRNAAIHFNLGNNLKFTGDVAGARAAFERALALAPHFPKAQAALSALGGATADRNGLARIEAQLAATPDARAAIHLHHAAMREHEALSDFDAAWAHLERGKRALRLATGADPRAALGWIERLTAMVPHLAPPPTGEPRDGPVLVLGMPRSGTTLVDRVVTNHRDIVSIGESLYFAQLLKIETGSHSRGLLDDAVLGALESGRDLAAIGARYVERGRLASGAARFLDKFHLNVLLAGHLMRAIPDARLLCLVRDPLDTIVGNYRQLFEFDSAIYSYSLDLGATADFYIAFRRLADAWEAWAPHRFRIVRYEALARDPEPGARAILDFCGLDWQEGVTAIERNAASVATASALQVRSGIHTRSIGSWRRYARHLGPARERLAAAGLPTD